MLRKPPGTVAMDTGGGRGAAQRKRKCQSRRKWYCPEDPEQRAEDGLINSHLPETSIGTPSTLQILKDG
ncbi:unnamed protein product [Pleuronectes platessa]|uniref:Uncharacterized protein n=1 Tax=Pleuronectes platessa TaxID=8262 RepID=A0A9N7UUW1_PLEPL|nr:unnamed protein product [Pleuronectes platessa]